MQKFEKGFFVGAATAAHQVEGNNIHSDYWAQEQLPHTSFAEPSGIACDPIIGMKKISACWRTPG